MRRIIVICLLLAAMALLLSSCQEGGDAVPTGPEQADAEKRVPVDCNQLFWMAHQTPYWIDLEFSINLATGGTQRHTPYPTSPDTWYEIRVPASTINTESLGRTWDCTLRVLPIGHGPFCYDATLLQFESGPFAFSNPVEIILSPSPDYDGDDEAFSLYEVYFDPDTESYLTTDEEGCWRSVYAVTEPRQYYYEIPAGRTGGGGDEGGRDWIFDPGKKGDGS